MALPEALASRGWHSWSADAHTRTIRAVLVALLCAAPALVTPVAAAAAVCPAGRYERLPTPAPTPAPTKAPGPAPTPVPALHETCADCPQGEYQDGVGQSACKPCLGNGNCDGCAAGTYRAPQVKDAASVCTRCASGKYGDQAGQNSASSCRNCAAGNCQPCAVGQYHAALPTRDAASACKVCATGTYQDVEGRQSCKVCRYGQYSDVEGQVACSACPAGQYNVKRYDLRPDGRTCTNGIWVIDRYARAGGGGSTTPSPVALSLADARASVGFCVQQIASDSRCSKEFVGIAKPNGHCYCVVDACEDTFVPHAGSARYQFQVVGSVACAACPKGKHSGSAPAAACKNCALGRYSDAPGQALCTACAKGLFNDQEARDSAAACKACIAGRYNHQTGQSLGLPIVRALHNAPVTAGSPFFPEVLHTNSTGSQWLPICGHYFWDNDLGATTVCQALGFGVGKANPATLPGGVGDAASVGRCNASEAIDRCTLGGNHWGNLDGNVHCRAAFNSNAGVTVTCTGVQQSSHGPSAYACHECNLGQYNDQTGQGACKNCPEGRYNDLLAANGCNQCAAGNCRNACAAGTYRAPQVKDAASVCTRCASGKYGDQAGQNSASSCRNCAAGNCQPCAVGQYHAALPTRDAASACKVCATGTYQDVEGRQSCKVCRYGQYSDHEGMSTCAACARGKIGLARTNLMSHTKMCFNGFWLSIASVSFFARAGGGGATTPSPIPLSLADATSSVDWCLQQMAGDSRCSKEYVGIAHDNGHCYCVDASVPCALTLDHHYQFAVVGSAGCQVRNCPAGKFSGESDCVKCAKGRYNDEVAQLSCKLCPQGQQASSAISPSTSSVSGACEYCGIGRYSGKAGEVLCSECEAGRYQVAQGQASCNTCPLGKTTNFTGASSRAQCVCTAADCCVPGTFLPENVIDPYCVECFPGQYQSKSGAKRCDECPSGKFQSQHGQAFCAVCLPGRSNAMNASASESNCTQCAAGQHQPGVAQSSCISCAAGTRQPARGAPSCIDCSPGRWSASKSPVCNACAAGLFGNESVPRTSSSHCATCPAGEYQEFEQKTFCAACGVGKHGDKARNTAQEQLQCRACAAGQYQPLAGSVRCIQCEAGQYQDSSQQPACKRCAPGSWSAISASSCTLCKAGHYGNASATQNSFLYCRACVAGKFQAVDGQVSCVAHTLCASGEHEAAPPSGVVDRTCAMCPVGRFSAGANAADCTSCPDGKYQRDPGKSFCNTIAPCKPGSYVANASATDVAARCAECERGHWCSDGKMHVCNNEGYQCNAVGLSYALPCDEGFVCAKDNVSGLVQMQSCPVGKSCTSKEVTACEDKVSDDKGRCVRCADDEFVRVSDNTCVKCPDANMKGIECANGDISVRANFFIAGSQDGDVTFGPETKAIRCRVDGVCRTSTARANRTDHTRCLGNTTGILCGICIPGHGKAVTGVCSPCPSGGLTTLAIWLFCAGALLFACGIIKKSLKPDFDSAVVSVLRIGVNFMMMTGFLANLQLDWGSVVRRTFSIAKVSGGFPPFMDCAGVTFAQEMAVSFSLPFIVPLIPITMLIVRRLWYMVVRFRAPAALVLGVSQWTFFINSCVALTFLVWPVLVVQTLRMFDCSVHIGDKRYLASNLAVECDTEPHSTLLKIAVLELVAIVPLLPLFVVLRLGKAGAAESRFNQNHLYFLYGGYREGLEWWETVVMLRKFLVLAVSVFLADNAFGLQVTAAMWVMCAASVAQFHFKPYRNRTEEVLETVSLCGTTAMLLIGQLIFQADGAQGLGESGHIACKAAIMIIFGGIMLQFVHFFAQEIRQKVVLARETRAKTLSAQGAAEQEIDDSESSNAPGTNGATIDNPMYASHRRGDDADDALKERARQFYRSMSGGDSSSFVSAEAAAGTYTGAEPGVVAGAAPPGAPAGAGGMRT